MTRPATIYRRVVDWPERLGAFAAGRRSVPFAWGSNDCVMFAADAVQALIGVDFIADWRGRYASEAEAEALLAALGTEREALDFVMAAAGLPECPAAFLRRGDVALAQIGNKLTMTVIFGARLMGPGPDGTILRPARDAIVGWAV